MKRGEMGRYDLTTAGGEAVRAFIPLPLPPAPPLVLDGRFQQLLERAVLALGRLDSLSTLLPDTDLFLYAYVRKEAVLSSQIEGTQSSLSDLLLFELEEMPGVPVDDVVEVSNYVAAMEHGLGRLRAGFPLSNRLLREIHGVLLARGRGSEKDPGEFRRTQNRIGGSRPGNAAFVPPPPQAVADCMSDLERFLHAGDGVLHEPLLYLSLYLKQNREEYYRLLDQVRKDGDWEAWLDFFLEGVRQTAEGAVSTARRLVALFQDDRGRIQTRGRAAGSALRVHDVLKQRPLVALQEIRRRTGLSFPAVSDAMFLLADLGIARELTGKKRNRVFGYTRYLDILSEGTEAL
jgi:Fic family protein